MMCVLLDPQEHENIYDPFCGNGGMLVACYKYIRKNIKNITQEKLNKLNQKTLYGADISFGTSQLAKMNMILLGDGNSNIKQLNSLENPQSDNYDCVVTNIPFNLPSTSSGHHYNTADTNSNNICIRHCIDAMRVQGRACIIVPENFCYDKQHESIRKFIIDNCIIKAVIRLPRETFKTYTSARACVLYLIKQSNQNKSFAYIEIENDGYSKDSWRSPISENNIPELLENKDELTNKYVCVSPNNAGYQFFPLLNNTSTLDNLKYYQLKELLEIKTKRTKLQPNKTYYEPRLSSDTNTIRAKGKGRIGKNIKEKEKIIIEPNDLVIATLHTQSGNGLFAISDNYYIATSQIVARIKENIISKNWLILMLKQELPKLVANDLVGREIFKPEQILSVQIPKLPPDIDLYDTLHKEKQIVSEKIYRYENDIKKDYY